MILIYQIPAKTEIYKSVSLDVAGKEPGTKMKVTGDYINYSMTVIGQCSSEGGSYGFSMFYSE